MNDDKKPEIVQAPGSINRERGPVDALKGAMESPQGAETQFKIAEELKGFIEPSSPETLTPVVSQNAPAVTKTVDTNQTVQEVAPKLGSTATFAEAKTVIATHGVLDSIRARAMLFIKKFQRESEPKLN